MILPNHQGNTNCNAICFEAKTIRFADAQGKKIVSFFGRADDRVYGPFPFDPARHRVLTHPMPCRPCYKRFRLAECHDHAACLTGVTVEQAFRACIELLTHD